MTDRLPAGNVHVLTDLPGWDHQLGDPGRDWHPRADKLGAYAPDGTLPDLTAAEVAVHYNKLEAVAQIDGVRRPGSLLDAEFSTHTPGGVV